ncbi:hypothetical protein VTP01DRAFT_5021 [Rhizomucor pusillus]|uniref:uncharacterized protein n=1 Tax=Rhizomucor pusillus TaxID=4840 RepID=UPI003742E4C5
MFKYIAACNELVVFSWCEVIVTSHFKSQIMPSSYAAERVDLTMEDTWKLIILITDSLRKELINYQDGRFATANRFDVTKVFELLCMLDVELSKQKQVRSTLMQEKQVGIAETIRWRLKNSRLIDDLAE